MDDPLKPAKSVPLSEETVLWFEFLLDPTLLKKHLQKSNPEPGAVELLSQFINNDNDSTHAGIIPVTPGTNAEINELNSITDNWKISRKQLGRKILALKVATWLKWNLELLEKHLPVPKQLYLLRDLCTLAFGKLINVPLPPTFEPKIAAEGNEKAARFAMVIYHRWVLRLQLLKDIAMKSSKTTMGNMFVPNEPMHQFFAPEIPPKPSMEYLQNLCQSDEPFFVFSYENFIPLHSASDETKQDFDKMIQISNAELRAQIYFDLVNFYLYTKQYDLAKESVVECQKNFTLFKQEQEKLVKAESHFCHVVDTELEGYMLACGVSEQQTTLLERFNLSQMTMWKDILEILQLDNHVREIPFENRRILELDIEGAISQGLLKERSLEMQVAALNVIRGIFEPGNIFINIDFFEKYRNMDCYTVLIQFIVDVLPNCSLSEKNLIKEFLIDCILKYGRNKQFLQLLRTTTIFSNVELDDLEKQIADEDIFIPTLAAINDWKFTSKLNRIDVGAMERQLIACTNANTVRKILVKIAATNPNKPIWSVNPSWEIATPLKSLLMSMHRGFLQDFAYVILGKSHELSARGDYVAAVSMLSVLKSETQRQELSNTPVVGKLGKLVHWEILNIQINQCFAEWNNTSLDLQSLGSRCKQCIGSSQGGDNVLPSIEIIENCAFLLLNLNDWKEIMFLDKRLPQLELPIAIATTFLDMEKMKGPKKIGREAWDIVLSMFLNISKRNTGSGSSRSSPCLAVSTGLYPFLKRIRHQALFSLIISLLGKIHNILKDDPNFDLNGEYMQIWPTSISNPIGYSIRSVSETLHWLLTEALKYYPQNIVWLKMKGDLELAIGNNEAAMRCYVNALVTGTDYCTIPLQRNVADDYVIRKMIRCSSNLGCHMQATVLCQFLEEIDYGIVFKNLTEKSSNFTDAMDAYYNCIWDTTLLEFIINLHAKKGEHSRKLEAIAIMGTLELNANNNEEIKREAAAVRKTRFLRALAKQYLL